MSWIQRKLDGSDDYDQQEVIKEYFENKQRENELKKFWQEYEQEYFSEGS